MAKPSWCLRPRPWSGGRSAVERRARWRAGFGLPVVVWASRLGAAGVRSRQAAKAPRGLGCRRRSPRRGAGRPSPMRTVWKSPTPALEVSALRLCGSARPVQVCRRSALRAGGGRGSVVCLAQRRRAAERSGVSLTCVATQGWAGRPSPMRTAWKSPTPALEVSALRLCGSARPVRGCRRSSLRAGGGRGSVVCLAQRRRAAERSGVSLTCVATQGWAGRPSPMRTVWKSPTPALEVSALRLCATCSGVSAIGSSSGRWSWQRRLSRAEAQSRREVWGVSDVCGDAGVGWASRADANGLEVPNDRA
jgi:hypothetical protein